MGLSGLALSSAALAWRKPMKFFMLLAIALLSAGCDENYGGEAHRGSVYFDVKAPGRLYVKTDETVRVVSNDKGLFFFENDKMYLLFASTGPGSIKYHYWPDDALAELLIKDRRAGGLS